MRAFADDVADSVRRLLKKELKMDLKVTATTVERSASGHHRPSRVFVRVEVPKGVTLPLVLFEHAHQCGFEIG